jgi:glyoxylase-like metal-dependent hydrolase (beta-lactamase superfamily II)
MVLAPNPSPMTLEGTNTWLLAEPGSSACVVVDPGPLIEGHLRAVVDEAAARDQQVTQILLTHGHPDHAEGAARLAELTKAPVRALDPRHRLGGEGLHDGEVIEVGGLEIRVVATPGHTADSLCFLLPGDSAVLTGDTVLGRGTTVVAHPDGRLADYLGSLHRLRTLAETHAVSTVLPGHGPVVDQPLAVLNFYLSHREERLAQVAAAVEGGARSAGDVVRQVYADVDPALWPAAELSVRAQLDYLASR